MWRSLVSRSLWEREISQVRILSSRPRNAVAHDTMGYRTFLFFCRRSLYSKQFSEHRGCKSPQCSDFLFYRRYAADFCFAPPYGKNQKVDRFIKRLQKKSNCSLDTHLLSISAPTGIINVPADFDTIVKAFSGTISAEKGLK